MARAFKYYVLLVLSIIGVFPLIFFVSGTYEVTSTKAPSGYTGTFHFFKSHDDLQLFARVHEDDSSKPYLIYLEDIPNPHNFISELELKDSLLATYNLIYLDYRGTGKSERFKNPFSFGIEHLVYDVDDLRKSLSLDKIHLMGHGFGALIAQYYAVQFPKNVEELTLVSPVISYDESAKKGAAKLAEMYKQIAIDQPNTKEYFDMYGYSIDDEVGFFGISKIMAHMDNEKLWFNDTLNYDKIGYQRILETSVYTEADILYVHYQLMNIGLLFSSYKHPHYDVVKSVSVPTHAIFGKNDAFAYPLKNKMDSLNGSIRFTVIDSAGYFPQIEQKSDFLNALRNHSN